MVRVPPVGVGGIHLGTMSKKELYSCCVPICCRPVKRQIAIPVRCIHLDAVI